jgi:signal transduction histidine kinase
MAVFYKMQKKWFQSEQFCKKTIKIADTLQLHDLLAKTYNVLSDIEEERGNYKKAYEYYIVFTNYNDSVNSKDQVELMHEMEAKYQSTAKDKSLSQKQLLIERSNAAIHNKNNLILFSISGIVIMVLLTLLIYFYNRSKRRLALQHIEALETDRELKILQAMMDGEERERGRIAGHLHDGIGGMISAIKMHLGVSKLENEALGKSEAYQQGLHLLEDMAKEVRKTAHNLMPEVLHKYGLEEAIRLHCRSTSNKTLEVHFQSYNLTKEWNSNAELIIYRIVQELVNNAVKHAACTEVLVDISQDEKSMTITVEDNGKGFTPSEQNSKDGMGLSNIRSKAVALEGKIELTSEPGTGTTVTIELPLQNLELT